MTAGHNKESKGFCLFEWSTLHNGRFHFVKEKEGRPNK